MPGATSSQSTTQQQYPKFVEGFGKDLFKDGRAAFNQGPYYYKGSTVTPFSKQTEGAFNGMMGTANANSGGNGMSGPLQSIMSNGGFNQGQLDSMAGLKGLSSNSGLSDLINGNGLTQDQNRAFGGLQNTVYGNNSALQGTFNSGGLTSDQRSVADRYRGIMNSSFDINSNPAYQSVRQQALDTQNDALSARAAAAGRYGGGMDQAILAREQGNLANRMDDAEYRNWQQRADASAAGLAGLGQQGVNNQLGINSAQQSGLQGLASIGQMGVDNRNNAIGIKGGLDSSLFNMGQAGLGNMGIAYQTAMQPYQTQRQVGQEHEDLYTRNMQDRLRAFDAKNPFNHLQQYSSLLSGAPMNTVQTTSPSWVNTIAGGLLAGSAFL